MNIKNIYNLKAWIGFLTGALGVVGVLSGLVADNAKLAVGVGSVYTILKAALDLLVKLQAPTSLTSPTS